MLTDKTMMLLPRGANKTRDDVTNHCMARPSSASSLLDRMHKQYCPSQYHVTAVVDRGASDVTRDDVSYVSMHETSLLAADDDVINDINKDLTKSSVVGCRTTKFSDRFTSRDDKESTEHTEVDISQYLVAGVGLLQTSGQQPGSVYRPSGPAMLDTRSEISVSELSPLFTDDDCLPDCSNSRRIDNGSSCQQLLDISPEIELTSKLSIKRCFLTSRPTAYNITSASWTRQRFVYVGYSN